MAHHRAMSALAWSLLVALSVLWGGSFFFVGVAVAEIPPLTLVALRVTIAAADAVGGAAAAGHARRRAAAGPGARSR